MPIIAEVVIDGATRQFDKPYSYIVPDSLKSGIASGVRVTVPFGRANLRKQGLVITVKEENAENLKPILSVLDTKPILNAEMLSLCKFLCEQTFCTYFDAVHALLPFGLNMRLTESYTVNGTFADTSSLDEKELAVYTFLKQHGKETEREKLPFFEEDGVLENLITKNAVFKKDTAVRKMKDATRKTARLKTGFPAVKITAKQRAVLDYLSEKGDTAVKEIMYYVGVTGSVITSLESKGIIETYEKEFFRIPHGFSTAEREEIILTDEQEKAYRNISASKGVTMLYGVTGSGKTQVFLKLVDDVVDSGKSAIIMVPEISLTPQTLLLFGKRYGGKVAVFHSGMSLGQRLDEWKRTANGEVKVAIGTRSAVFAPLCDIDLIIIDEEQEHTYKSEQSPRFHAVNVAKYRAAYNKCRLVLASATPSLESYSLAKIGKYSLERIENRYGNATLPEVVTVDMKKELVNGNSGCISTYLCENIKDTLSKKKQAIILLNRRGHNTYISCAACGTPALCPECSISLTYHSANRRLMCHYCGRSFDLIKLCPECGSENMRFGGAGTQKVEEELKMLFPSARILRVDADTTVSKDSLSNLLTAFSAGEYDIMLGTQMVAKGLDFPNVTLVGVIGADRALYSEDFRSYERTFSLLTQVIGRAGRGDFKGKAVIQTDDPESNIIKLAAKQDYDAFFDEEIESRRIMAYPPFCDIAVVWSVSADSATAEKALNAVFEQIKALASSEYSDVAVQVMGISAASVQKINGKYRFRMLIKCKNSKRFRELLRKCTDIKKPKTVSMFADINPESVI